MVSYWSISIPTTMTTRTKKKLKVAQMILTFSKLCDYVYDLHASKKHLKVSYIISR